MDKQEIKVRLMREKLARTSDQLCMMSQQVMARDLLHCANCRDIHTGMPGRHPVQTFTLHDRDGHASHTVRVARCEASSRIYAAEPVKLGEPPPTGPTMRLVNIYGERCAHTTVRVAQVSYWQPVYPLHKPSGETRQVVCESCGATWTELWELDSLKDL